MSASKARVWLCALAAAAAAGQASPPASPPAASGGATAPTAPPATSTLVAGGGRVAIIRIEGVIYDFTLESLRRRVDRAREAGATVIVLELDTPGGLVSSALDIAKYIRADIQMPTVAWIHRKAYSAGILIASACDQIVMSPASTTGDCAPIVPDQELSPTERAKALSPILEEFRDNARDNGYDYAMFHAMCVLGIEVYLIEHRDTGQRRLVNQADYGVMVDGDPFGPPAARPATSQPNTYGASAEVATAADVGAWELVKPVHDGRTLLTVHQDRAFELGLAKAKDIGTDADLSQYLKAQNTVRIPQSWSEDIAGWLTSPWVRAGLVLVLLMGAYMEFQSPGLGLPGAAAVIALVILLGAPYLVGLAEVWHLLLFFLGFILLLVEVLIIPGFGVFGVLGLVCMFTGLVVQVVPTSGTNWFNLPPPEMFGQLQTSLLWMLTAAAGSLVGFYFLFKHFDTLPVLNRLILRDPTPVLAVAGAAAGTAQSVSGDEAVGGGAIQVGAVGQVVAELRPTGRAEIDGQIIDVVTPGDWLAPGRPVRVIEVHGNRIVVEESE